MSFTLLPAVDISDGRLARSGHAENLAPGSDDPYTTARRLQADGAEWLHLVDLDAAYGRGTNAALLASIVRRVDIPVEVSGGIHDDDGLAGALATGCDRVVISAIAVLERPDWCRAVIDQYGSRIAIALDAHATPASSNGDADQTRDRYRLAPRGWARDGGDLWEVLARLEGYGCQRYLVTDVTRDGMLNGPNLALLTAVCSKSNSPVIASGGIASIDDLTTVAKLQRLGLEGAVLGTALHTNAFTLRGALDAVATA